MEWFLGKLAEKLLEPVLGGLIDGVHERVQEFLDSVIAAPPLDLTFEGAALGPQELLST